MKKVIEIDEGAIYDAIHDRLEKTYTLTFPYYDSVVRPEIIAECLGKQSLEPLIEEDIFNDQRRYSAENELSNILDSLESEGILNEDQIELFKTTSEYYDLLTEICSRDDSDADYDCFRQTSVHGRIMLHSNYDCFQPIGLTQGVISGGGTIGEMMRMLSLNPAKVREEALARGLKCKNNFLNLRLREGKEVVTYKDFVNCLIEAPDNGLWTFFGSLDMDALLKEDCNPENLVIPKGTLCTVYNDWSGSGALSFTNTIRPLPFKDMLLRSRSQYDKPEVYVDEKLRLDEGSAARGGYPSSEVYGGVLSNQPILVGQ